VGHGADCHAARARLERLLSERFGLAHSTLQVEHAPPGFLQESLPLIRR
jgi:cobalt-zinc-cadmium efflux system protein